MPPITELSRIEPMHLARLEKQGIFTTGILLEVSETPTRRQSLADHVKATTNDVGTWRDEALMLNLAGFGTCWTWSWLPSRCAWRARRRS